MDDAAVPTSVTPVNPVDYDGSQVVTATPEPDDIDQLLAGIEAIEIKKDGPRKPGPTEVALYSLIGRPGGAANGELDPTPIKDILQNPARFDCAAQWRNLKHGCPFAEGSMHSKGKGIAFTAKNGVFFFTCYSSDHEHPGATHKTNSQGNSYWLYTVKEVAAGEKRKSKFPPFKTGSHREVAMVLLSTRLLGAVYDTPTSVRIYDNNFGDENTLHRKGAKRASPTAGKWFRISREGIEEVISELDGEWVECGTLKDGTTKYEQLKAYVSFVSGVFDAVMSRVTHLRQQEPGGVDCAQNTSSRFSTIANQPCIGLQGSILDLETGMIASSEQSWSYYVRAEHMLPTRWWGLGARPPCPRWNLLLHTAWGHQPDYFKRMHYFQEWVGVTLAGQATKHQVHTLLKGVGASGKSQVIEVVTALFPASTVISVEPAAMGRFDTAQFDGALLQVRADMATGTVNAGIMKTLQSGDAMQVEKKHKDGYVIRARAGWLLSCNSSWRPSERDDSVYRRWTVLTFDRPVPEDQREAGLAQKIIAEELQGIIAWAVEGYQRFRANGHKYTKVPSSALAISEWREDVEPMRQWAAECLGPQGTGKTKASTLYDNYVEWAKNSGCKNAFNKKNFGLELTKLGYQKKAAADANYYDVPLAIVAAGLPSVDALLDD